MDEYPHKARIKFLDGRNADTEVKVLLNPTELNVEHSVNYKETTPPGLSSSITQFVNEKSEVLTVELLFDTHTDGHNSDVSVLTNQFITMASIDSSLHAPPRVSFLWGVFSFVAVVERVTQRFTMFTSDGVPVRANLSVTFRQYRSLATQVKVESADKTKRRVFESHDSIWLLADREYGDTKYWRLIAARNRIEDPRRITPGTVLVLPPLDDEPGVTP